MTTSEYPNNALGRISFWFLLFCIIIPISVGINVVALYFIDKSINGDLSDTNKQPLFILLFVHILFIAALIISCGLLRIGKHYVLVHAGKPVRLFDIHVERRWNNDPDHGHYVYDNTASYRLVENGPIQTYKSYSSEFPITSRNKNLLVHPQNTNLMMGPDEAQMVPIRVLYMVILSFAPTIIGELFICTFTDIENVVWRALLLSAITWMTTLLLFCLSAIMGSVCCSNDKGNHDVYAILFNMERFGCSDAQRQDDETIGVVASESTPLI